MFKGIGRQSGPLVAMVLAVSPDSVMLKPPCSQSYLFSTYRSWQLVLTLFCSRALPASPTSVLPRALWPQSWHWPAEEPWQTVQPRFFSRTWPQSWHGSAEGTLSVSPDSILPKGLWRTFSVLTLFCSRALVISPDSVLLKGLGHQSWLCTYQGPWSSVLTLSRSSLVLTLLCSRTLVISPVSVPLEDLGHQSWLCPAQRPWLSVLSWLCPARGPCCDSTANNFPFMYSQTRISPASLLILTKYFQHRIMMFCLEL